MADKITDYPDYIGNLPTELVEVIKDVGSVPVSVKQEKSRLFTARSFSRPFLSFSLFNLEWYKAQEMPITGDVEISITGLESGGEATIYLTSDGNSRQVTMNASLGVSLQGFSPVFQTEANTSYVVRIFCSTLGVKSYEINRQHYATTTTELALIPESSIIDGSRIYVKDELSDYFYDKDATEGGIAPSDQTGGLGFWIGLRDKLSETQFAKTIELDLTAALTLDKNGRYYVDMDTIGEDVLLNISTVTMSEGGALEIQVNPSSFFSITLHPDLVTALTNLGGTRIYGSVQPTLRNDISIIWNDQASPTDITPESRIRSINIANLDAAIIITPPIVLTAVVEDSDANLLIITHDKNVDVTNIAGQTLTSDGNPIAISSYLSGSGSSILTYLTDRDVVEGEQLTYNYDNTNTVVTAGQGASYNLDAGNDSVTNNVLTADTLNAPVLDTIVADSGSAMTVNWTDTNTTPNEESFTLEYDIVNTFDDTPQVVAGIILNSTSYQVIGLDPNTEYFFRIKAIGDGVLTVDSPFSNIQSQSTPDEQPTGAVVTWDTLQNATTENVNDLVATTAACRASSAIQLTRTIGNWVEFHMITKVDSTLAIFGIDNDPALKAYTSMDHCMYWSGTGLYAQENGGTPHPLAPTVLDGHYIRMEIVDDGGGGMNIQYSESADRITYANLLEVPIIPATTIYILSEILTTGKAIREAHVYNQ